MYTVQDSVYSTWLEDHLIIAKNGYVILVFSDLSDYVSYHTIHSFDPNHTHGTNGQQATMLDCLGLVDNGHCSATGHDNGHDTFMRCCQCVGMPSPRFVSRDTDAIVLLLRQFC